MSISALEACDLLRFAPQYEDRLKEAAAALRKHPDLAAELAWLRAAQALVADAATSGDALLERARGLPELPELRADRAGLAQAEWVDALEKLLAGITFHVSGRAPIIEALFPHQKLAPLRRAAREVGQRFQKDLEKRLKSTYVTRMLGSADFAFAVPVVEQLRAAFAAWEGCFGDGGLPPDEAATLRTELAAAGARVDRAVRQARLLAEAALLPVPGAFETAQLGQKPRRRSTRQEVRELDGEQRVPSPEEVAATEAQAAADDAELEALGALAASSPAPAPKKRQKGAGAPAPAARAPRKRKTAAAASAPEAEAPQPDAGT